MGIVVAAMAAMAEAAVTETTMVCIHSQQPFDINCGRPSIWGNPYSHLADSLALYIVDTPETAVARYREWLLQQPILMRKLRNLRGKRLGCYCPNDGRPCHVRDVIIPLIGVISD